MEAIWAEILAQAEGELEGQNNGEGGNQNSQQKSGETNGTQEADKTEEEKVENRQNPCALNKEFLLLMLAMFAIMYFIMIRPQKKRQPEQQKMLQAVKKNTRIRTIGGIIGTIVDLREDEVVIKIDETTNTKMRIARSAIGKVITEEDELKSS